jgi:hypothetical protein
VSGGDVQRLGREVANLAAIAAVRFNRPDCVIEVDAEGGSLTSRARVVAATLFVAYGAIADYGGFKEGIVEITHDAHAFAEYVSDAFMGANNVPPTSVRRIERRTKTPGRLLRIMKRREWLNRHRDQLNTEQVRSATAAIEKLTGRALEDLTLEERPVVEKLLASGAQKVSDQEPEKPLADEVERVALEERTRQPVLFDFGPGTHTDKDEFHTRFRLSDWQREHPPHGPR